MKVTKKVMLFLACVCILVILTKTSNVYAKDKYLKENVWYDFDLDKKETDEYTFKVPSNGYFYYEVVPEYRMNEEEKVYSDWYLGTKMLVNYKVYVDSSCDSTDGLWTSRNYSFAKGTKVRLNFATSYSSSGSTGHYKVRIVMVKPKNFEIENNNKREKANKLKLGTTYTGLIIKDDVDWFIYTAPKTGKYKISGVNINDSAAYYEGVPANIYNKEFKLLESNYLRGGEGWTTVFSGTMKKGEKVYMKLSYEDSSDIFYKLKVKKVK